MKQPKGHLFANIFTIAGAVLFYVLYRLSFLVPGLVEDIYSRGFFKFINQIISSVTGVLPFSLAEFLLYGFILFVAAYLVYAVIVLIVVSGNRFYRFLMRLLALVAIAASLVTSFIILWGFNYAREPLAKSMSLETAPVAKETLYQVCLSLVDEANTLRKELPENDSGVFISDYKKDDSLNKVPKLYENVAKAQKLDIFDGNFGSPKLVLNGKSMSYGGLVGVYFPFTGEANVNSDMPMLTFLAGACHEAAHQHGFAREDEANFIAYYICREGGDRNFAYSGTVLALMYAMGALNTADKALYKDARSRYSDALNRDMNDYSLYWDAFKGPAKEAVETVNNNYLKANMQADGVKSYGRMVDLLAALYNKEHSTPAKAAS